MKIKLGQIVNAAYAPAPETPSAFQALYQQPVKAHAAFRLKKIARDIALHVEMYEDTRLELCKKYGTLDEETQNYKIEPDSIERFTKEFHELLATEVEIDFEPLNVFALGDAKMSPSQLQVLDWLFTDK